MQYCCHCGKECPDADCFCPACGHALVKAPRPAAPPAQPERPKADRVNPLIVILCIFLPLLGMVLSGIYRGVSPRPSRWYLAISILSFFFWFFLFLIAYFCGLFFILFRTDFFN